MFPLFAEHWLLKSRVQLKLLEVTGIESGGLRAGNVHLDDSCQRLRQRCTGIVLRQICFTHVIDVNAQKTMTPSIPVTGFSFPLNGECADSATTSQVGPSPG